MSMDFVKFWSGAENLDSVQLWRNEDNRKIDEKSRSERFFSKTASFSSSTFHFSSVEFHDFASLRELLPRPHSDWISNVLFRLDRFSLWKRNDELRTLNVHLEFTFGHVIFKSKRNSSHFFGNRKDFDEKITEIYWILQRILNKVENFYKTLRSCEITSIFVFFFTLSKKKSDREEFFRHRKTFRIRRVENSSNDTRWKNKRKQFFQEKIRRDARLKKNSFEKTTENFSIRCFLPVKIKTTSW